MRVSQAARLSTLVPQIDSCRSSVVVGVSKAAISSTLVLQIDTCQSSVVVGVSQTAISSTLVFQIDSCQSSRVSRPPLTQLENIGSAYPFYVSDGNRPLAPLLRQKWCSLMYDVY